ncbi:MAG TPA: hypothetical protein VKM93_28975 [Terriglobia bacterium]|nr:hypothetical protein [Terriglobia bacterium]
MKVEGRKVQSSWFVVPDKLATVMREEGEQLSNAQEAELLADYRERANDREREAEALEWCEALIGDATL